MYLVTTKEAQETLKIKIPDRSIFNMSISQRNTKEYLAHVIAVLCLICQKGLNVKCRKLVKAVDKLAGTLKNLLTAARSKTTILSDDDVEARKLGIEQTQEMLQEAQKAHDKAIAKTFVLLRNLLSSDTQTQLDYVCHKMHKHDSWAKVNSKVTKGRCPCTWAAFQDCLELHKLMVFIADAAKRQRFYLQQVVRKPQGHCETAYLVYGSVE
jgi:hypothetical protein